VAARINLELKAVTADYCYGCPNFTVFPAARHFGWISPRQVNLRKVAVITVSKLVAGRSLLQVPWRHRLVLVF